MEIELRTLTPLWTGGVDQVCDRLHETGLIGSLRWWYEALVRGLGGYACDPTSQDRCPDENGKRCAACELFGCTGWARKFRLRVLNRNGELIEKDIGAGQEIVLQFIDLRPISEEEKCLLSKAIWIAATYGALGGKTIFKPSDEASRKNALHHQDFGLVQFVSSDFHCTKTLDELKAYISSLEWRSCLHIYRDKDGVHDYSWVSLDKFWCVKNRYLARQSLQGSTFNVVLGKKQDKRVKQRQGKRVIRWSDLMENPSDKVSRWLAGRQQESKKVFSFSHPEGKRTFGFVKPGVVNFDDIKQRLKQAWTGFNPNNEFLTGEQILELLFSSEGGGNDV